MEMTGARPARESRYASDTMARRAATILEAARYLLSQGGGFSMKALAAESGVAVATLYNIFGSKENLVADAVIGVFKSRVYPDENRLSDDPLERIAAGVARASTEILKRPEYARAMLEVYFSQKADRRVSEILHEEVARNHRVALTQMRAKGELSAEKSINSLADDFTALQYSVVANWAAGRIPDRRLRDRLMRSTLDAYHLVRSGRAQMETDRALRRLDNCCDDK